MISPQQITIDVSALPQSIQNLVTTIDNALTSWTVGETVKYLSLSWAGVGGWTQQKENTLKALVVAYEMRGWITQQVSRDGATDSFKVGFQRP